MQTSMVAATSVAEIDGVTGEGDALAFGAPPEFYIRRKGVALQNQPYPGEPTVDSRHRKGV